MKLIKKLALAAAIASVSFAASAMDTIADSDLSQVSGQDGVSIAADLKIDIGSFVYKNNAANGGSVSFNTIKIGGTLAATMDVISGASFFTGPTAAAPVPTGEVFSVLGLGLTAANLGQIGAANTAGSFYAAGTDVVRIAIPTLTAAAGHELNVSVDSIKMGGNTAASFGSFAMNDIKLQGTSVYIWAH